MSFEMIDRFIKAEVPTTERFVGVLLGNRHNGQTGRCDPSIPRLADESGLSRRAVEQAIQRLERGGHLTVLRTPGRRNFYRLHPKPRPENPRTSCAGEASAPANEVRETGETASPPPANVLRGTSEPRSPEPERTVLITGREPEVQAAGPPPQAGTAPFSLFSSSSSSSRKTAFGAGGGAGGKGEDKDFATACETKIAPGSPEVIRQAWTEFQEYRQRRHQARGAAKLLWTAQAARLSAGAIGKAVAQYGESAVADRITAAIAGEWRTLNFDTMSPSSRSKSAGMWGNRGPDKDEDYLPNPDSEYRILTGLTHIPVKPEKENG